MTQQITKDLRVSEAELLRKIAKKEDIIAKYKEKCAKSSKKSSYLPAGYQYSYTLIELSVLLCLSISISFRNISTIFGILKGFFDFPECHSLCQYHLGLNRQSGV